MLVSRDKIEFSLKDVHSIMNTLNNETRFVFEKEMFSFINESDFIHKIMWRQFFDNDSFMVEMFEYDLSEEFKKHFNSYVNRYSTGNEKYDTITKQSLFIKDTITCFDFSMRFRRLKIYDSYIKSVNDALISFQHLFIDLNDYPFLFKNSFGDNSKITINKNDIIVNQFYVDSDNK